MSTGTARGDGGLRRPEVRLDQVRPGTRRDRFRFYANPRVLAWGLGGALAGGGAAALIRATEFPGSSLLGGLVGLGVMSAATGRGLRRARRLQEQERLLPRRPEQRDLSEASLPDAGGLARLRRVLRVSVGLGSVIAVAVLIATPWVAMTTDPDVRGPFGLPRQVYWVIGPLAAANLGAEVRRHWRSLRRIRDLDLATLEPNHVTVVGFCGLHGQEVVFVPGAVSAGAALDVLADVTAPSAEVFAAPVGAKLGQVVAGDVLVCHGRLDVHEVVHLSGAHGAAWALALRVPARSEIFKERLLTGLNSGATTGSGPGVTAGADRDCLPDGIAGRTVRVAPAYGTPPPVGPTPGGLATVGAVIPGESGPDHRPNRR